MLVQRLGCRQIGLFEAEYIRRLVVQTETGNVGVEQSAFPARRADASVSGIR